MSLYFAYGAYATLPCTVRMSSRDITPLTINEFIVAHQHTLTVEVTLYRLPEDVGDNPVVLSAKMQALEAALAIPDQSGGVAYGGSPTQHWLPSAGAIGQVHARVVWQDTPLHMATEARGVITLTAIYGNPNELRERVVLRERVRITGEGGADTVLAPQAGQTSIYQIVSDFTDVEVVQAGSMVGRTDYPLLPNFLITTAHARKVRQTVDDKEPVQLGTDMWEYRRSYQFTFNLPAHPGTTNPTLLV